MWIIQEPKKVALWNKRHFEEKNGECAACLKYSVLTFVEKKYIKCNIWRVAVRPSCIQDARFLNVNCENNSVILVTRLRSKGQRSRGLNPHWEKFFLFSKPTKAALSSTLLPVTGKPVALFPGKAAGAWVWLTSVRTHKLKIGLGGVIYPPIRLRDVVFD